MTNGIIESLHSRRNTSYH